MIRHIIYGDQFLFPAGNDASNVFLQLVVLFRLDEALPAFNGEHDVDVNLRVGVGHVPKMPLLTELENLFCFGSTKMSRLRRCGASRGNSNNIKIHIGFRLTALLDLRILAQNTKAASTHEAALRAMRTLTLSPGSV
jgi:hypothetical protein